jgi:hypothetical protein
MMSIPHKIGFGVPLPALHAMPAGKNLEAG